ncbi:MAG: helix-turn-helix transcriptional regulator [Thermodesulfobacteriota bacterium]
MDRMLSTREVAEFLGVNEKMIYSMITEKGLPATKVSGKWLFPRKLVEQWVLSKTVNLPAASRAASGEGVLVVAGSNDLLLDRVLTLYMAENPGVLAAFANLGSLGGIRALGRGQCQMAASHLAQENGEEFNFSFCREELADLPVAVNLSRREQGVMLPPGNPRQVGSVADVARQKLRVANRAPGTGTRLLFERELRKAGFDPEKLPGWDTLVPRHLDAGLAVLGGRAQAAPGIRAVAGLLGLDFLPVSWERYDLLVPRDRYFDKPVQLLLNLLHEDRCKALAADLQGYDLSLTGKTVFPRE